MRAKQYRGNSNRDRSLSPRRPARNNVYPSRNRENSPRLRRDEYSRDSGRSNRDTYTSRDRRVRDYEDARRSISPRRIDRNVRLPNYNQKNYDSARRSNSPRKNERRAHFDRDANVRTVRYSEYDDFRRVYDDEEDLRYAGSRPQPSDRPKKIVVDGNSYKSDYYVSGGERELRVGYSDELLPVSRSKQVLPEYVMEGKNLSDPYTWADNVSAGGATKYSSAGLESSSGPRYLTSDTERQRYVQFQDEVQLDKRDGTSKRRSDEFDLEDIPKMDKTERILEREFYTNGKDDHLYFPENRKVPRYSLSQPKDYASLPPSTYKESSPYFSGGGTHASQSRHGVAYEDDIFSEPIEKLQISPRILGQRSVDKRNSSRSYHESAEETHRGSLYDTSEIDRLIAKPRHLEDEYIDRVVIRGGVSDSTAEKSYKRKYAVDDPVWELYPSSIQQSDPDKFYLSTSLHERKRDLDILGSGREAYVGRGNMKSGERYTEVRSGPWSDDKRLDIRSRDSGYSLSKPYDTSQNMGWDTEDVNRGEAYGRRPRHEHVGDDDSLFSPRGGMKISCDGYGARKIYNPLDDEMESATYSKKPKVGEYGYDKASRIPSEMHNHPRSPGKSISRYSSSPRRPKSRDVKSRLGPLRPKLHVSQRLDNIKKPSIKNRLGPPPSKKHAALPRVKVSSSSTTPITQDDSNSCLDQDGHMMEQISRPDDHMMEQISRPEPSEKSAEFKQLVQSAFFKFLKQINETPVKRKQYTEQGKAGGLKCIVCGSDSKEFTNTERLAMHTFTSEKSGLRSQHLGLHKALCVVNGWKTAELPINAWHCEKVSNAENTALKEDIIIWPPVVIVHNSTIDNKNSDERIILSTEELDLKIKGMGFSNFTKVCNGKPANQSVMVVKFNGTLSGLQEAERLHKSYVETKQHEPELQQLETGTNGSSGEGTLAAAGTKQTETELQELESVTNVSSGEGTPAATETKQAETDLQRSESRTNGSSGEGTPGPAASKEKYLDGHLGLVEDLDKLDFGTRRRCVLRSKIEILSIAVAPLDANGKKSTC